MLPLIAVVFLTTSTPETLPESPPEVSTIQFTTSSQEDTEPEEREILLPPGSEIIRTNYVSYPCPDYKAEVLKEGFIMNTGQVAHLFGALSQEKALAFQPDDSAHYLVIRVKNTGCLPARGVIRCELNGDYLPFQVQIPNLKPHMEIFAHYVIPLQSFNSSTELAKNYDRFVHLEWDVLSIILDLE